MPALRTSTSGSPGSGVTVRITNLNQWLRALEQDYKDGIEAAERTLHREGRRHFLAPSKRLCPKDTERLVKTADLVVGRDGNDRLNCRLRYDTEYAIYVHEDPNARHKPPTQWKFAEVPLVENAERVAEAVLAAVLREFA